MTARIWPEFSGRKISACFTRSNPDGRTAGFFPGCETASMRTTLDLPDPLFKHLKTRAAQEGRTLRDLVVELVEKGLSARDLVDAQQRFQARPLIKGTAPMRLPPSQLTSADLSDILSEEDDERARQILQSR
jgi:plasmid stability protein